MARFRIIHVTDLHISVVPDDEFGDSLLWMLMQGFHPSRARRTILEAAAAFIVENQAYVDALVISGDLADDGDMLNLETAREFLEGVPIIPGEVFTVGEVPTLTGFNPARARFILPGNHDRFIGTRRLPGGTAFDTVFSKYWHKGVGGVQSLLMRKSGGSLGLVAADFCLQSTRAPVSFAWGEGAVTPNTLASLREETLRLRAANKDIVLVWIFHFPPVLDGDRRLKLHSGGKVLTLAKELGVTHVFAGHVHKTETVQYQNTEIVCTGSAASEYREHFGNWIRIVDFDVQPSNFSVSHETYVYNPEENAFVSWPPRAQGLPAI